MTDAAVSTDSSPETTPETLELAAELRVAVMRTSRILRTQATSDVVSPGQNSVLSILSKRGALTMRQLADIEHVQAPSMTRTVNHLCESGLVARTEHPTDGRLVVVDLTPAGRGVLEESRRLRAVWLASRLDALPPEDRAAIHRAAELLRG